MVDLNKKMEKYPEIKWPEEFSELKTVENLLKCEICYDYMDTPVITPCSHNYCSLCIRKYLHYKTRCPLCFHELFENQLNPNRILEEILINFAKVRTKLNDHFIKLNNNTIDSGIYQDETSVLSQNSNQNTNNSVAIERINKVDQDTDEKTDEQSSNNYEGLIDESSLDPTKSPVKKDEQIKNDTNSLEVINKDALKTCPVCQVNISGKNIDKHVDNCSKREANPVIYTTTDKKRPQLPKLVLNLMKDSELRKKLKDVGLSTKGTRKVLETRYQRYCTIYNAECDKRKPRSAAELLKQCNDQEKLEKTTEPLPINMRYKH